MSLKVTISSRFLSHTMSLNAHLSLPADIKKNENDTLLFRQLCKSVIPDQMIWANRNAELMEADYKIIIACRGNFKIKYIPFLQLHYCKYILDYVQKYRETFNEEKYKKTLSELCCEARRQLTKINPTQTFSNPLKSSK